VAEDYSRLRAIPLFASLKDDELAYIGSIAQQTFYPADATILTQGYQGETFYIVASGQVRVVHQDESGVRAVSRLLGQGEYFGEIALLYGDPISANVETVVPTTLLFIEQEDFQEMLGRLPSVRRQLEKTASRRGKAVRLVRFDWQTPDEIVLWRTRRNVIPLFFESLGSLLFWHLSAAALAWLSFADLPRIGALPERWQWALRFVAFVMVSLVWVWYVVDWTNDYLVLTNRRVVHVERFGILSEMRSEIPIRAVQNVEINSGWPTSLLRLANITVKTIGGALTFTHIAEAEHLQSRILEQRALDQQAVRHEDREDIRQTLIKVLRPESLVVPPPPAPGPPDALAALPALKQKRPPRTPMGEWLRTLGKMRVERGEEITWRKHWLILLRRQGGPILVGLAGIVSSLVLWLMPGGTGPSLPPSAVLMPLLAIPVALLWGWWQLLVWGGDIYILTEDRIVDIERLPLGLREKRRESNLDRIQDIDVNIPNFFARMFAMGNVYIKTGAAGSDLTFNWVADPYSVQRDIFHKLARLRRNEDRARRRQTMEEITRWLMVYNELTTRSVPSEVEEEESDQWE
jgi:membrane protein YdbS with pleckstrin-like domain